jgi:hypothetical protein
MKIMEMAVIREDQRRRVRESLYMGVDCAAYVRSAGEAPSPYNSVIMTHSPSSPAKRPKQLEDSVQGSRLSERALERADKMAAERRKRTLGEVLGAWSLLASTARRQAKSINLAKVKPFKSEVITPRRAAMRRGCCLELAAMGKWKELASIFSFPNGPSLLAQSDEEGCNALHM